MYLKNYQNENNMQKATLNKYLFALHETILITVYCIFILGK